MSKLIKTTLAEQAYRELRDRILGGQLGGGMRLLPGELAEELGISPTPVREALTRLEADGLAASSRRRGVTVRQFTVEDVKELYHARAVLEYGAITRAFRLGTVTDALIEALVKSTDEHRIFARDGTFDSLSRGLEVDREFHRAMVAAGGVRIVSEWHEQILRQTHTVFVSVLGTYSKTVHEHEAVLEALKARDLRRTLDALGEHFVRSLERTLLRVSKFEERSADGG